MNSSNVVYAIRQILDRGWEFNLECRPESKYRIVAWRPEWVTSNYGASKPCETFDGDTVGEVFDKALASLR